MNTSRRASCFDPLLPRYTEQYDVTIGEQIIRLLLPDAPSKSEPLVWLTPDKLPFDAWRGHLPFTTPKALPSFKTIDL